MYSDTELLEKEFYGEGVPADAGIVVTVKTHGGTELERPAQAQTPIKLSHKNILYATNKTRFPELPFKPDGWTNNLKLNCLEIKIDEKRGLQLPPPKTGYFYQVFFELRHIFLSYMLYNRHLMQHEYTHIP